MSLFGSLFTGVSALGAQSQSMAMISNNIANVNTTGYKRDQASFSSLVTQAGNSTAFSPGGVNTQTQRTVQQQGILQKSASATDVAISGSGFFVVQRDPDSASPENLFTRAGSFAEDNNGRLVNSDGFTLMGWPIDANGDIPANSADLASLEVVDVSLAGGLTSPTSAADVGINLDAGQDALAAGPHFVRSLTVYDSLGSAQTLRTEYTKTGANAWDLEVFNGAASLGTTAITFNGDGSIATPAPDANGDVLVNLAAINWGNGSDPQDIDINVRDVTQFASSYDVSFINQNGSELGLRTALGIDEEGFVSATFTNGLNQRLYKLPVATFPNVNGLKVDTGNVYSQTQGSGDFALREAGSGGAGLLAPSALEASNVDLADEFSKMIITQRAYSAGTKIITTSDQMLNELLSIR